MLPSLVGHIDEILDREFYEAVYGVKSSFDQGHNLAYPCMLTSYSMWNDT